MYLPLHTTPFALFPKLLDSLELPCATDQRRGEGQIPQNTERLRAPVVVWHGGSGFGHVGQVPPAPEGAQCSPPNSARPVTALASSLGVALPVCTGWDEFLPQGQEISHVPTQHASF